MDDEPKDMRSIKIDMDVQNFFNPAIAPNVLGIHNESFKNLYNLKIDREFLHVKAIQQSLTL